jgi:hypothetical protein
MKKVKPLKKKQVYKLIEKIIKMTNKLCISHNLSAKMITDGPTVKIKFQNKKTNFTMLWNGFFSRSTLGQVDKMVKKGKTNFSAFVDRDKLLIEYFD